MALIRATCTTCGDIELRIRDVTVRVCNEVDDGASYHFKCPICNFIDIKPADSQTVDILVSAGSQCQYWDLPSELWEPTPDGPPIDHDDLLDFHELLMQPNWYKALESMT